MITNSFNISILDDIENVKINKNIPVNEIIKEGYKIFIFHLLIKELININLINKNNPILYKLNIKINTILMKLKIANILKNKD